MSARARCIGFAVVSLLIVVLAPALGVGQTPDTAGAQFCCLTCGSVAGRGLEKGTRGPVAAASPTPPTQPGRVDVRLVPQAVVDRATAAGYSKLLAGLYEPAEEASRGAFAEKGYVPAGEYKEEGPMPAGYWVYVAPYWTLWDLKNGKRGE